MTRGVKFINFAPDSATYAVMKQNKEVKISYMAAHLTTIVSVTLVLILIGIISLICISARNETRRLKSQIELSVVMADSVSDADARQIALRIDKAPYSADVRVVGKEEAMRNWQADTGETAKWSCPNSPNGTTSSCGVAQPNSRRNTSAKAPNCWSRAKSGPAHGKTTTQ